MVFQQFVLRGRGNTGGRRRWQPLHSTSGRQRCARVSTSAWRRCSSSIAFGGFVPTYWAKLAAGTFDQAAIYHLHGIVLSWTLYFFAQTALVATGRTYDHRNRGLPGIALATAIGFTVTMASITTMRVDDARGVGDATRRFAVSFIGLVVFAILFVAAIVTIRRPEWHKRLMILTMIPFAQAAIARIFLTVLAPPGDGRPGPAPPLFVTIPPGLTVDLLIIAAMVYDRRTRGRVHRAYAIGLPFLLATQMLTPAIGGTAAWMTAANNIEHLMG